MKISVALAAYRGEPYIAEQLASVLSQLGPADEVIVSDDDAAGCSLEVARSLGDSRIVCLQGPGKGVVKNVENAINACTGELIFLCDQDDVWLPGKVSAVVKAVEGGAKVVLHDAKVTDAGLNVTAPSFFAERRSRPGFWRNLLKNSFVGCCMAFTASYKDRFLPFPERLPMHDWWIGLLASRDKGAVVFLPEPLLLYRRHAGTVTGAGTGFFQKIAWRVRMLSLSASRFAANQKRSNV